MSQKADIVRRMMSLKKEADMEKNMYTFYAFMNRMKLIQRWNLMRSNIREDLMQHTAAVAIFGQALGIIRNTLFGGDVNVDVNINIEHFGGSAEELDDLKSRILEIVEEAINRRRRAQGA